MLGSSHDSVVSLTNFGTSVRLQVAGTCCCSGWSAAKYYQALTVTLTHPLFQPHPYT